MGASLGSPHLLSILCSMSTTYSNQSTARTQAIRDITNISKMYNI